MDPKMSWKGDRVIIVGDNQRDLPPSLADIWQTTLKDIPRAQDSDEGCLYDLGKYAKRSADARSIICTGTAMFFGTCPSWSMSELTTFAVSSISNRVVADFKSNFIDTPNPTGPDELPRAFFPTLAEIFVQRITWSTDPSAACVYKPAWPGACELVRGPWAGDRFDVVPESFDREGKPWRDIGQKCIKKYLESFPMMDSPIICMNAEIGVFHCYILLSHRQTHCSASSLLSRKITTPFPVLPSEIRDLIFQFSAEEDKEDGLMLMQVSKEVSGAVAKFLYHHAVIGKHQEERFIEGIKATDFGRYVQRLYIPKATEMVIRSCPNLQVLFSTELSVLTARSKESTTSSGTEEEISFPSPWFVAFEAQDVKSGEARSFLPKVAHPLFHKTTHLLINPLDLKELTSILSPDYMPSLQYIAVHHVPASDLHMDYPVLINQILKSMAFPDLKCLLWVDNFLKGYGGGDLAYRPERWVEMMKIEDDRYFVRREMTEWEYEDVVYGGRTIWDDAAERYKDWRNLVRIPATLGISQN
jgi:hypothetical protein